MKPDPTKHLQIGFLLQRAHNTLRTRLVAELAGTGLHLGHVAIMGVTLKSPGLSQRELSALTGIEKSSVVIFVDKLEEDGLLRRESRTGDRRARSLLVTDRGVALLQRIGPRLHDAENRVLSVLSALEQQRLADSLAKLIDAGP